MSGKSANQSIRKPNRLANEKSPYLLQHAHNPVDWYSWGDEAIAKAKKENKPIFLSIGYSSCHWCHVMERESFEDMAVAKLLNDNFVSIKVDREERPDLDEIYMKAVMALTGSGGWPLNVFLTPDLEPFYGGTYFPPTARYGMSGFSTILQSISRAWKADRKEITKSASGLRNAINDMFSKAAASEEKISEDPIDDCFATLAQEYDHQFGGFGSAPKFPTPSYIFFLLRYYLKSGEKAALQMAVKTLDSMSRGGIYDQIGGGFHRYSTDREWLVPHFEKMLYDNALLTMAYTEAYQITKNESYRGIVLETLSWALSEMVSKEGAFFSAQDADTSEGEGAYYLWTGEDVKRALSSEKQEFSDQVSDYFSITSHGNYEGKSILTIPNSSEILDLDKSKSFKHELSRAKKLMFAFRAKKPAPFTDDKILTSWNGLMISSLARASRVFEEKKHLLAARRAADFILDHLWTNADGKGKLLRRFRDGETGGRAVLEDYAYFGNALVDLYEASFEPKYLENSLMICEGMISDYYDRKSGGFFSSEKGAKDLILRTKDSTDGALPSGNSMATLLLLRISELTSREEYRNLVEGTFRAFWSSLTTHPASHSSMLATLGFLLGRKREIVISGEKNAEDFIELLHTINEKYLPYSVLAYAEEPLKKLCPIVSGRVSKKGERSRVYVCTNFACKLPSRTRSELLVALES